MPMPREPASAALLLVDGAADRRELLARRLQRLGHDTEGAGTVERARDLLRAGRFDLVLLRLMAAGLDGFAVLEAQGSEPALGDVPVLALATADQQEAITLSLETGADDCLVLPCENAVLERRVRRCLEIRSLRRRDESHQLRIEAERRRVDDLVKAVIPIGVSLMAETNFDRLLEAILVEAKSLCNADGGTLYLRTADDRLSFSILRNDSLGIALGGTSAMPVSFPPLPLRDPETGEPNLANVATYVAVTGRSVNVPDAYAADGFEFSGTRAFDARTGYRSTSFLTVPLENNQHRVIGVLQLLNALDPDSGAVIPFDPSLQPIIESLSLLAAAALEAYLREECLRREIADLHIQIDESKRARQVAEIADTDYFQNLQDKVRALRSRL
jgi:DNA-binding response OmpR family regulator